MRGEPVIEWSVVLLDEYARLSAVHVLSNPLPADPSEGLIRAQAGQFLGLGCGDLGSGLLKVALEEIGGENKGGLRELKLLRRAGLTAEGLIFDENGEWVLFSFDRESLNNGPLFISSSSEKPS
jgi:hypothetical protein